jgi:hypothetical protein
VLAGDPLRVQGEVLVTEDVLELDLLPISDLFTEVDLEFVGIVLVFLN